MLMKRKDGTDPNWLERKLLNTSGLSNLERAHVTCWQASAIETQHPITKFFTALRTYSNFAQSFGNLQFKIERVLITPFR